MDLYSLAASKAVDTFRSFDIYPKQNEVVEATAHCPVTLVSSCNGAGKTALGSFIDVCHWTGEYPDSYTGLRIEETGEYWVLAPSAILLKNAVQEQLFMAGDYDEIAAELRDKSRPWPDTNNNGAGKLSKTSIVSIRKAVNLGNTASYVQTLKVRHVSGGVNTVKFYHYELGVKKLAGKHGLLFWHCDEFPPADIFAELKARQTTSKLGIKGIITATPEKYADQQMIADAFDESWEKMGNARIIIDIMDVPLRVMPTRQQKIDQCAARDAAAKLHGLPVSGTMFFELNPEDMRMPYSRWVDLRNKEVWKCIYGIDFGFNDATGFSELHVNPQSGVTVLSRTLKKTGMNALNFSGAARQANFDIARYPCSWPHDGMRRDSDMTTTKISATAKKTRAQFYKEAGFNMLPSHTKKFVVEANKHDVWAEMESAAEQGLFYVVAGNHEFEEEWRKLQLGEDGKAKGQDHLLDSTVCAWQNRAAAKLVKKKHSAEVLTGRATNSALSGVSSHLYN